MKIWRLPNFKLNKINFDLDWNRKDWHRGREIELPHEEYPINKDLPKGWRNRWPDLPNPDDITSEFFLDNVNLSKTWDYCEKPTLLGYYISWHIVGVSFRNQYSRLPHDGMELRNYNEKLPSENRFGIHICCKTIENYINRFSTEGLDSDEIDNYLDYCTYLTLIYVIAHEWGHYRSEVLSFQISDLVKAVSGEDNNGLSPSYLSYFENKKHYPDTNFEEVFAEWASLKLGIFNYFMKKPVFAETMANWPIVESTVKLMLTQAISRPNRIRPYSDIRYWIDFQNITRAPIMNRLSENKPSLNRSVNDNVVIDNIKSFKKGKIIDLLMHNQLQFSCQHQFNGIVMSAPLAYPYEPDSLFYHFGDDECIEAHKASDSDNFLKLSTLNFPNPNQSSYTRIKNVVDGLKVQDFRYSTLPIKVFSNILPLDPVYFHT
jgi:hypothetical protein